MIGVDYGTLDADLTDGTLRKRLEDELVAGFRAIHEAGERLPTASHYASRIAEIISQGSPVALAPGTAFDLYQEILMACEGARAAVLGEGIE